MSKSELKVGEIIVANIIGLGFYEIHSFGKCFVNVKCLKLFCKGWQYRGHITNCHNTPEAINLEKWLSYKRVNKPININHHIKTEKWNNENTII